MDLEVVRIYAVVQTQTERSEQSGEEAGLGEESGAQRHGQPGAREITRDARAAFITSSLPSLPQNCCTSVSQWCYSSPQSD